MNGPATRASKEVLFPLVIVVATLYLAREFLIPLALAVLLSFLLAPVVKRLERWHIGRVAAVIVSTLLALAAIVGIGVVIGGQLVDLAKELPKYQTNLQAKMRAFKAPRNSPLAQVAKTLQSLQSGEEAETTPGKNAPNSPTAGPSSAFSMDASSSPALNAAGKKIPGVPNGAPAGTPADPLHVEMAKTAENPWDTIKEYATPIFAPLGTAALVTLIVIFFLLDQEDMRDRLIHLIGRGHLQVTTQALDEAAWRVSRYLLAQFATNVGYGIPIGIGLYFIGIPNAVLWGLLSAMFRFIPYIGVWLSAAFPILLSLAISPGWTAPLLTIGLYVVTELIVSNAVEPWLYGSSTGMSPIAIIISAAFWAWLWGGIGLLLATPLTVCIAVLGKYIPSLTFLDVILGDKPPIAPEDRFYQRLLATDEEEVWEIAEKRVKDHSLPDAFENLVIPTLRLTDEDFHRGTFSEEDRCKLLQQIHEIVSELGEPEAPAAAPADGEPIPPTALIIPASDLGDETAGLMLARLLAQNGVHGEVVPSKLLAAEMLERVAKSPTRQFCVSVIPTGSSRQALYLCKRLRVRFPDARIIVGMWGETQRDQRRLDRIRESSADVVFTSLAEAAKEIAGTAAATVSPAEADAETKAEAKAQVKAEAKAKA